MAGITGRDDLHKRLAQAWPQARCASGRVGMLLGDAGMGKSGELSWLANHISAPAHVITCRGGEVALAMSDTHSIALRVDGVLLKDRS